MLFEWRIQDIERKATHAEQRLHELDAFNGRLVSLEYSLREIRADCLGIRAELEAQDYRIRELEQRFEG